MVSLSTYWNQLLWDCYHHGKDHTKDDSPIRELLGNYLFIERPQDLEPPMNEKIDKSTTFLKRAKKGFYNIPGYPLKDEALYNYITSLCDKKQIYNQDSNLLEAFGYDPESGFVYTYPERIFHTKFVLENGETSYIDQEKVILQRLNNNLGSNRAVATLYQAGFDHNRIDIPCLNWLQVTVRDNQLELHCMFRSNDLFGAWPSNMYFLTFLGLNFTGNLNMINDFDLEFNGIHYHSSSLHIYETDFDAVRGVLGE